MIRNILRGGGDIFIFICVDIGTQAYIYMRAKRKINNIPTSKNYLNWLKSKTNKSK